MIDYIELKCISFVSGKNVYIGINGYNRSKTENKEEEITCILAKLQMGIRYLADKDSVYSENKELNLLYKNTIPPKKFTVKWEKDEDGEFIVSVNKDWVNRSSNNHVNLGKYIQHIKTGICLGICISDFFKAGTRLKRTIKNH